MRLVTFFATLLSVAIPVLGAPASAPTGQPAAGATALPAPLPIDESIGRNGGTRNEVIEALRSGTISNAQTFENYFKKYELPRMTSHALRPESESFTGKEDLPGYRKLFKSRYLNPAKGAARTRLNEIVLTFLTGLFGKGPADEVLKYNATLMIGDLTAEDRSTLLYGPAYKALLSLAKNSNPKADYLKVAAMVGLQRHAEALASITPSPMHDELMNVMVGLLRQQQPPEGRTAGGHAWIRANAAKVLGALGVPGKDNAVARVMNSIVIDETAAPSVRYAAVEALGQLNYSADAKLPPQPYVREIGKLVLGTINKELADRASRAENPMAVADDLMTRRKLKAVIHSVNIALGGDNGRPGLAKMAGQDKNMKALTDALRAIELSVDKDAVDDIPQQVAKLEEVLQTAFGLPRTETDKAVASQ
jgi:hypothetical protein